MVSKHLISQVRRNENEGQDNKRCVDVQVFDDDQKEMCECESVKGKEGFKGFSRDVRG